MQNLLLFKFVYNNADTNTSHVMNLIKLVKQGNRFQHKPGKQLNTCNSLMINDTKYLCDFLRTNIFDV